MDFLKKIAMNDVIFWAAVLGTPWSCFILKNYGILSYIIYEEDLTQNVSFKNENSLLEKLFFKIPRCGDVNVQDVDEWLIEQMIQNLIRMMTKLFNLYFIT